MSAQGRFPSDPSFPYDPSHIALARLRGHFIIPAKRPEMRYDLPGGGRRLVMPAHGVQYTIVNGQVLYAEQKHTGALPGQVLRSGGL